MSSKNAAESFREKMLKFRYKDDPQRLAEELAKFAKEREERARRREERVVAKEEEDRQLQNLTRWRYKDNPEKAEELIAAERARDTSVDNSLGPDRSDVDFAQHMSAIRDRANSMMDFIASAFDQSSSRAFGLPSTISEQVEVEFRRVLSDPKLLDDLDQAMLDRIRLASQTEIERLEDAIRQNAAVIQETQTNPGWTKLMEEHASKRANAEMKQGIVKHRLMIRLIEATEMRRASASANTTELTEEEKRLSEFKARQLRIDRMRQDRDADIEHLRSQNASEEELVRRENMWNDGIVREEAELEKWLA
jgi:hypothetical protein